MCGIAGALDLSSVRTERGTLESMTESLSHRGPDGIGISQSANVSLGHRRLRILDLSERADQPMWNDARTLAIVFNGEIYNFKALRHELEASGASFRTESDTEVVLKLYEREQEGVVERLDGMFALAIWDETRRSLFLARDRAGQKPLFFYRNGSAFVFGSEAKALHRHPAVPRQPNLDALPLYLTYGYIPAPSAAYQGVRTLEPATWMRVDSNGDCTTRRYWTPPYEVNGIRDLEEATDRLKPMMADAVQKRLISDVPLGAFLSGGIDSTIVVGLMSEASARPVKTFSIGFEGAPDYDEVDYAEEAAHAFGCEHQSFRVRPPEAELFDTLVRHHDGPFGDSSAIPTYIVSRLARSEVTVVLNGDGGDELFAGYSRLAAAAYSESVPQSLRRIAALGSHLLPAPRSHAGRLRRVRQFLDATARPLPERIQTWCSFFRQAELADLLGTPDATTGEHFEKFLSEAGDATPLARVLYLNFCTYLPEDLLVKVDRMSMAHGLEARSPFLDTPLTEFAGRLPDRFKIQGLTTKRVLREAFRDLVPDRIQTRSKMGFGVPLGKWFRGELRPFVEAKLTSPRSVLSRHLNEDTVRAVVAEHMQGRRDRGQQIFCLLTLALWLDTF